MFRDRRDAGHVLATHLSAYQNQPGVIVLALPRGGVPVAYEVAKALHAPLDIVIARKLGAVQQAELAVGAIASGGTRVLNQPLIQAIGMTPEQIEAVTQSETEELLRRERTYRGQRPPLELANRTVILVDDGLATGATMRAAVIAVKKQRPARVVVAVPTGAQPTCYEFRQLVDEVICAITPEPFDAVGLWYQNFTQVTDEEVHQLLREVKS